MAAAELLDLATTIATEAAELAARRRAEGVAIADQKSSLTDVVTAADQEVEQLIRDRIAAARPDDGISGEEGEDHVGRSGLTWVVDPIDGTVNYLYDLPHWAVSIAVVEGDPNPKTWTAQVAAIAAPAINELYTSARGRGAYRNGRQLFAGPELTLDQALLATGFAYRAQRRSQQAAVLQQMIARVRDMRRYGAAALDLANVASGRLDAYYEPGLWPWDFAAGALIAEEAGAWVGDLDGGPPGRDLVIACHCSLRDPLVDALHESGITELMTEGTG